MGTILESTPHLSRFIKLHTDLPWILFIFQDMPLISSICDSKYPELLPLFLIHLVLSVNENW